MTPCLTRCKRASVARRMADVQPFRTLRYDSHEAGPLEDLIAPPYDVIDERMHAQLAARSHYNVVELDLPESYEGAARALQDWREQGVLVQEDDPAMWVLRQDYTAPDGRTSRLLSRAGRREAQAAVHHRRALNGVEADQILIARFDWAVAHLASGAGRWSHDLPKYFSMCRTFP